MFNETWFKQLVWFFVGLFAFAGFAGAAGCGNDAHDRAVLGAIEAKDNSDHSMIDLFTMVVTGWEKSIKDKYALKETMIIDNFDSWLGAQVDNGPSTQPATVDITLLQEAQTLRDSELKKNREEFAVAIAPVEHVKGTMAKYRQLVETNFTDMNAALDARIRARALRNEITTDIAAAGAGAAAMFMIGG